MTRTLWAATAALIAALLVVGQAAAQPEVQNLRVAADASGGQLPEADAPQGEKQYHLDSGTADLYVAFDCASPAEGVTQVRVMQPPGTILFQEEASCAAGGQQVVLYDRKGLPFPNNEYVVNLYVGDKELYLADSVQFAVGDATIPPSAGDSTPIAAQPAATLQVAPLPGSAPVESAPFPESADVESAAPDTSANGGPSLWLLAVAGFGILLLVAVVAWAGWSATRV